MTTLEEAAQIAQLLIEAAHKLGLAINEVERAEKLGYQAILDEQQASETLQIQGFEVMRAMRLLALRLDRAALLNHWAQED